ncbi:MAG TPA: CDP-diacylglycerol--glycerol-3-phosphate 3-phosphatidyltransferase [Syntrophaceae bacterium]|nr:CDP-diacylglycerol--glycerol-3-phosphate 3-phosphatidyltransferase [Syntrophaceae bacterium]
MSFFISCMVYPASCTEKPELNIPNLISIFRIIVTPLFLIYLMDHAFTKALVVFVIAGISDAVDGFIARVCHRKTTLGAHLDPMADKLLLSTAFITLAIMKFIPAWLAVLVISRDVLIVLGFAIFYICQFRFEPKPTIISKVTTHIQFYTIIYVLLTNYSLSVKFLSIYLFWICGVATIASGLHYIYLGFNILNRGVKQNKI